MENAHNQNNEVPVIRNQAPQTNPLAIPVAIVVAGALIAGAVLMGNRTTTAGAAAAPTAAAAAPSNAPTAPSTVSMDELKIRSDDHVFGNKNGNIVLVEWSDPECPFCKRHDTTMEALVKSNPDVAWVYRYFALDFHVYSKKESESMECVSSIAGDEVMHNYVSKLFDTTQGNNSLDRAKLTEIAKATGGIDIAKFDKCVDSGEMAARIQKDMDSGTRAGVQGTPYTIAYNKKTGKQAVINGAQPQQMIDQALASIK